MHLFLVFLHCMLPSGPAVGFTRACVSCAGQHDQEAQEQWALQAPGTRGHVNRVRCEALGAILCPIIILPDHIQPQLNGCHVCVHLLFLKGLRLAARSAMHLVYC